MKEEITFGAHVPVAVTRRAEQSAMAAFTRGPQVPGMQWKFHFLNGYGASVINDGYGAESGLYEVAVLGPDGRLNYDTPLTNDVLGYLTHEAAVEALDRIAALPTEGAAPPALHVVDAHASDDFHDAALDIIRELRVVVDDLRTLLDGGVR